LKKCTRLYQNVPGFAKNVPGFIAILKKNKLYQKEQWNATFT
jgi:hypothetical protein